MLVYMWIHQAEGLEHNPNYAQFVKNIAPSSISSQIAAEMCFFGKFYSYFYIHIEPHALLLLTVQRWEGKQIQRNSMKVKCNTRQIY